MNFHNISVNSFNLACQNNDTKQHSPEKLKEKQKPQVIDFDKKIEQIKAQNKVPAIKEESEMMMSSGMSHSSLFKSDPQIQQSQKFNSLINIIEETEEEQNFDVLVVNDEIMQLEVISYKFEITGQCNVEKAVNGFEAFDMVMKKFNAQPQQFYDIIVLDLHMPISDGYETCDKIFKLFNQQRMFSHDECII